MKLTFRPHLLWEDFQDDPFSYFPRIAPWGVGDGGQLRRGGALELDLGGESGGPGRKEGGDVPGRGDSVSQDQGRKGRMHLPASPVPRRAPVSSQIHPSAAFVPDLALPPTPVHGEPRPAHDWGHIFLPPSRPSHRKHHACFVTSPSPVSTPGLPLFQPSGSAGRIRTMHLIQPLILQAGETEAQGGRTPSPGHTAGTLGAILEPRASSSWPLAPRLPDHRLGSLPLLSGPGPALSPSLPFSSSPLVPDAFLSRLLPTLSRGA